MSTTAEPETRIILHVRWFGGCAAALEASVALLRSQQKPGGWWKGALDTNVTMDAEDLMMRAFLDMTARR